MGGAGDFVDVSGWGWETLWMRVGGAGRPCGCESVGLGDLVDVSGWGWETLWM